MYARGKGCARETKKFKAMLTMIIDGGGDRLVMELKPSCFQKEHEVVH